MFYTTMSMKNQLLVFTMYCLVTLPRARGETQETLTHLLQVAEEQHGAFKRSLDEINKHMSAIGETSVDSLLPDRRDNLEIFSDSLVSFCQTFITKQRSNSNATFPALYSSVPKSSMIPTKPSVTLPTSSSEFLNPEWEIPTASILPQSAHVVILPNETLVQFKVQHSVTGFVIPALTIRDLGNVKRRMLRVKRNERLPKVSEVAFTIQTHWCAKYVDKPRVYFNFYSKSEQDVSTGVEVKVCEPSKDELEDWNNKLENTTTSNDLLPPKAIYRYKLTKEKGQNTTFLAEINLNDFQDTHFYVVTRAYNQKYRNMSLSVFTVLEKLYKDPTSGFEIIENPDTISSRFTAVEDVTDLSEHVSKYHVADKTEFSLQSDLNESESSGNNQPKGLLKLTFNTAMGDETAIVYFTQTKRKREGNIGRTAITLPLFISGDNELHNPIPDDIISFDTTPFVQTCNTNKLAYIYQYMSDDCAVRCQVFGKDISLVQITKKDGAFVGKIKVQPMTSQRYWSSILKLDPWKPSTNGTYQCKVWNSSGREFVHDIDLIVAGFPRVYLSRSYANDTGNGTVTLVCSATGTDVDISFVRVEPGEHGQINTRIDDNPNYEKTIDKEDNKITSTLVIPEDEAKNYLYHFICNATNSVAYDPQFIDIE